jgi:hypothetical protein
MEPNENTPITTDPMIIEIPKFTRLLIKRIIIAKATITPTRFHIGPHNQPTT